MPTSGPPFHGATPPQPRTLMSTYDTRPPPPILPSSGFAAVNQPPHNGFAAVNSRPVLTPPALTTQMSRDSAYRSNLNSAEETPVRPGMGEEKNSSGSGTINKRTPSTTHPYQMSEAFANRHHHCERTDSLNRGIWTWYGSNGTHDRPTAPATEMYLKCNHDNCGRIDWRTVHGLQCHIVKNHEQPKGTIGSLEKALAAYGVPVRDIEEIEKRDGLGSGGTTADPKNVKVRAKVRESGDRRDLGGRETPVSATGPMPLHKNPYTPTESPATGPLQNRDGDRRPFSGPDHKIDGSASSPIDVDKPIQARPGSGFAAVNSGWTNLNPRLNPQPSPVNRDQVMRDLSIAERKNEIKPDTRGSPATGNFWSGWSGKPTPPAGLPGPVLLSTPIAKPQPPPEPISQPMPEPSPKMAHQQNVPVLPTDGLSHNIRETHVQTSTNHVSQPPARSITPVRQDSTVRSTQEREEVFLEQQPKTVPNDAQIGEVVTEKSSNVTVAPTQEDKSGSDISGNRLQAQKDIADEMDVSKDETVKIPAADPGPIAPQPMVIDDGIDTNIDNKIINTPAKENHAPSKDISKLSPMSPEMNTKRIASRRESRRTSIATASSRFRDEDEETNASKSAAENAMEDEGDTIEVNFIATKADQREKDHGMKDERTSPPRRGANGRFTRRSLR